MDAMSIGWIPGITGRHLPIPIVPRCYTKTPCSRRSGSLHLLRLHAFAIPKTPNGKKMATLRVGEAASGKKVSIFRVGEAPFCQFLPRMARNCHLRASSSKTDTRSLLPFTTLALSSSDQEYGHQTPHKISAECVELGSSLSSGIAPSCYPQLNYASQLKLKLKERRYILKSRPSFDEAYNKEIFHRKMVLRLKASESAAAAAPQKNHDWIPLISYPDHDEPLRPAPSSNVLGNSLAMEDENWLLPLKGGRAFTERSTLQLEQTIDQRLKETMKETSSTLKHSFPPIMDRLRFQLPPEVFYERRSRQRGARVDLKMSYQMSYVLEGTDYDLEVDLRESDIGVLHQNGILESHSNSYHPRKATVFARSMDYRTSSSRETTSTKMGLLTRERVGRSASYAGAFRYGRIRDPTFELCAGSRGTFRYRSRVPPQVPAQNYGAGRRLWSRAHSGLESAGNLFKDLLTIVGLVAFVVYGTYAFAMSQKYLKSGLWFRKPPSQSVGVTRSARPAQETKSQTIPTPVKLNQTKIVDITDENFVNTIQQRPTFVLFYASWCPYCQKLDPTWKELGNILTNKGYNIQLARMNAEIHPKTAANFKVVKYPTLIFFRGGIAVENYLGPRTVDSLVEFVDETLNKPS
ncbi:unnamed protein product [Calypogeia fissa]